MKKNFASALMLLTLIGSFAQPLNAAKLADQGFGINTNSYSNDDLEISSTSLFIRKTLDTDTLSLKSKLESMAIDDSSTDQVFNADPYSETQNGLSLGADYLYYDSTVSVSGGYATVETTSLSDLALDFIQSYGNGTRELVMGISHNWESDSDLGMFNKSRLVKLGSNIHINPVWVVYLQYEFSNSDGDLENFRSARRFDAPDRTVLPDGRTDQKFTIISNKDVGKSRYVTAEISLFSNDWKQSGNSVMISLFKVRSEKLSTRIHAKVFAQEESKYFVKSITGLSQQYFSDHRYLASQDFTEAGIMGQWKFSENSGKRIDNIKLDVGYTYIKTEYGATTEISNTGSLVYLNLSGNY